MGIFDFITGGDSGKYFDEASDIYKEQEQKILDEISKSRAEGRGDITGGFERAIGMQKPYMEAGTQSLAALLDSLGIGQGAKGQQGVYDKFTQSPTYQYALKEGLRATQASSAARGMSGSGAEQMALQERGAGLASQNWENYLKNYQDRLSDLSGMGQRSSLAASQFSGEEGMGLANLGLQYSGMQTEQMSALAKAMAEARMAKGVNSANQSGSIWGALGSLGGAFLGGPGGAAIGNWLGKKLG